MYINNCLRYYKSNPSEIHSCKKSYFRLALDNDAATQLLHLPSFFRLRRKFDIILRSSADIPRDFNVSFRSGLPLRMAVRFYRFKINIIIKTE